MSTPSALSDLAMVTFSSALPSSAAYSIWLRMSRAVFISLNYNRFFVNLGNSMNIRVYFVLMTSKKEKVVYFYPYLYEH